MVKDLDQVGRHHVGETHEESIDLIADALVQHLLHDKTDVLELVLIVHFDVFAAFLQLNSLLLVEELGREHEVLAKDGRVILKHVCERLENVLIEVLDIAQIQWLAEHHLVEGAHEEAVEKVAFIKCLANDSTDEAEHRRHLGTLDDAGARTREVGARVGTLLEESIAGIKDALRHKLEPFTRESALVDSLLIVELDNESLLPRANAHVLQLFEAVREHLVAADLQIHFKVLFFALALL